jgi:hypothetical protein
MTYTVTFQRLDKKTQTPSLAGCVDAEHARYKLMTIFPDIVKILSIKEKETT